MANWQDVQRIALGLPDVTEGSSWGKRSWAVHTKTFVWERPLRPADWRALAIEPNEDPVLGVRVPDLQDKEALTSANPEVCFATPHFDGYPAILVWLDRIDTTMLEELVTDAWLDRAPKRLAQQYLADRHGPATG